MTNLVFEARKHLLVASGVRGDYGAIDTDLDPMIGEILFTAQLIYDAKSKIYGRAYTQMDQLEKLALTQNYFDLKRKFQRLKHSFEGREPGYLGDLSDAYMDLLVYSAMGLDVFLRKYKPWEKVDG